MPTEETQTDQENVQTENETENEAENHEEVIIKNQEDEKSTEEDQQEDQQEDDNKTWLKTDDDEEEQYIKKGDGQSIPKRKYIHEKNKLKGRISERDDEIAKLKQKIETFERTASSQFNQQAPLKRPSELDFDTDDEYRKALDKYEDDLISTKFRQLEERRQQEQAYRIHQESLVKSVEDHYDRALKLIENSDISVDVYRESDNAVRNVVNTIAPGRGDMIVDQIISNIGEGSDKVMFYIGRNKSALNQFKSLLLEDPSGMKLAVFLGEQKQRLTAPVKMKSRAPKPSPSANGDANMGSNVKGIQKKYNEAHKKGDRQKAWDYRREARKAGIDTSKW